jgi:hypothetical protein
VADSISALSGTLLRQPQPTNGSHVWEPYVLYYQDPVKFDLKELVLTSTGWKLSLQFYPEAFPYRGSPVLASATEGGYSLQVFWHRANDTRLLARNATFNTFNVSSYNPGR